MAFYGILGGHFWLGSGRCFLYLHRIARMFGFNKSHASH